MSLVSTLILFVLGYLFLHFAIISPMKKRAWPSSTSGVLAKAGVLAAGETATSFLQLALIVWGVITVVTLGMSGISPLLTGRVLAAAHSYLLALKGYLDAGSDALDAVILWIALAAIAYFVWRTRRVELQSALRDEYRKQLAALIEKVNAGEKLEALQQTPEMR